MKCNPAVVAGFVGASGKNTGHLQVVDQIPRCTYCSVTTLSKTNKVAVSRFIMNWINVKFMASNGLFANPSKTNFIVINDKEDGAGERKTH